MNVKSSIKKGMRLVFVDFLGLVVGILNGFFLPAVFSIDGYAFFRTFTLYATYAVVFSFGLSDGIYLAYGGKNESDLDLSKTRAYYFFLIKMQALVCIVMYALSYFILKDTALMFFSFFIIPLQIIHFLRLYYRALGEFDKYSFLQGVLIFFELLNTLFIVFYINSKDPYLFILIKVINHVIVAALFSFLFFSRHKAKGLFRLKWTDYYDVMKPGLIVLTADMAAALIISLDRWFVKLFFSNEAFAYYSFAVSIFSLFFIFITSIANIFYSYISKNTGNDAYIRNLKTAVLIISSFFPLGYFVLRVIIQAYLVKYTGALEVLWILTLALPFVSIINVVYINQYKASKDIIKYLKKMTIVLFVSVILYAAAYSVFGNVASIAWAALAVIIVWYFYSSRDFEGKKVNVKEVCYLSVLIASLLIVKAADVGLFLSLLILMVVLIINVYIFYSKDFGNIFKFSAHN